jgi:hypothetical protein
MKAAGAFETLIVMKVHGVTCRNLKRVYYMTLSRCIKVKVKLSLSLIKHDAMKTHGEVEV